MVKIEYYFIDYWQRYTEVLPSNWKTNIILLKISTEYHWSQNVDKDIRGILSVTWEIGQGSYNGYQLSLWRTSKKLPG